MKRDEVIIDKHTLDDFFLYSKGLAIITIVLYHLVYFYCDWIPAFIRRTQIGCKMNWRIYKKVYLNSRIIKRMSSPIEL